MKNHVTIEAVYIYIYIEGFNKINLIEYSLPNEAMYFRRI